MSTCLSVCMYVCHSVSMSTCLSVRLYVFLCLSVCVCLSVCMCLSVRLYVHVSVCPSVCVCLSVCMCVTLSVCPRVCLFVCMCLSVCPYVYLSVRICLYVHVSVCQGQWLNNVFNGEGKLTQVSGASYEGLWINGRPAYTAVKLVITGLADTGSIRVAPGQSFTVSVECHTEYGEVMPGRNVSLCPLFHSSASCIFHVMN